MNKQSRFLAPGVFVTSLAFAAIFSMTDARAVDYAYHQTNLVSDQPGVAAHTDVNLVNPWGIALSPASFFWIANNHSNTSTLYNGEGVPSPATPLIVNVPGGPTGQVFNSNAAAFGGSPFIFAGEDGVIRSWVPPTQNTQVLFNSPTGDGIYKGLAISNLPAATYLLAADFHNGRVDVFSSTGDTSVIVGNFLDPSVPAGFVPFNIQRLGSLVYVTYAFRANPGDTDETAGAGLGYVSAFDVLGGLVTSIGAGGPLNAPWGLAIAPDSFGDLGGNLLVGNFGDGTINAYNPTTGTWLRTLRGLNDDPLVIDGLWGLAFGNGVNGGDTDELYFTAGPDGEEHGLFGELAAVAIPEPGTYFAGAALSLACIGFWIRGRKRANATA